MNLKSLAIVILFLTIAYTPSKGQIYCLPNADFETGTTSDWQYLKGNIGSGPVYTLTPTPPISGHHTLTSGSGIDPEGGFPVVGKGLYSLQLLHNISGALADAAVYFVHIPVGGSYNLIYHYAAVLEDPSHAIPDQPRFEVTAIDSVTGIPIPAGKLSLMPTSPGFIHSTGGSGTFYKPWSTGIMDLSGCGGKTVTTQFIAAGCALGGHFGYGYIEMDCLFLRSRSLICGATSTTLDAPPGYSTYSWTDSMTFSSSYGTTPTITVTAPTVTTTYAVILTPVSGHGTIDTLYTTVLPPLVTDKSRDTAICLGTSIPLTLAARSALPLTYSWSPSTGLSCTTCDTVIATPPLGVTSYIVSVSDTLGCTKTDTINITVAPLVSPILGSTILCTGSTITVSDATTGGTWSSSVIPVATIGSTSGIVTGISGGTTTITYTMGCSVTATETVFTTPTAISGSSSLCQYSGAYFTDTVTGGTWSSSNTTIASVSSVGYVYGRGAGTATISYTTGTACTATMTITIMPSPSITGTTTVCLGATSLLTGSIGGGTWTSDDTLKATVGVTTGLVTSLSPGYADITYTLSTGCKGVVSFRVDPLPSVITGVTSTCIGGTTALSDSVSGGSWSCSNTTIATIGTYTGIIKGLTSGTATITYSLYTGCMAITTLTVTSITTVISGPSLVCVGATITLSDATTGGSWSSSDTTLAIVGSSSGIVTGVAAGYPTISYTLPGGCTAIMPIMISAVTITSSSSITTCGDSVILSGAGGTSYTWAPSSGLSCTSCPVTDASPLTTTTYTVTGVSAWGCPTTDTITVNGDRIFGHIDFSGTPPGLLHTKIWLIQFNPVDSSISALDSTMSCDDGHIAYYEFDYKPAGNYMVKAKMMSGSGPGSSGYVPTYSLSAAHWDVAATVAHSGASDSMHITMIYGTIPSGPGFIGGYVYSGAGKGTSGDAPASNMLILLENASSHVVTYAFTDTAGSYAFNGLANGDYIVYPEEYSYRTTHSAIISLDDVKSAVHNINFRQYIGSKIIIPINDPSIVSQHSWSSSLKIFPNPTNGSLNIQWKNELTGDAVVVIKDVVGKEVYRSLLNISPISGETQIDLHHIRVGIYLLTVTSGQINYSGKLLIER